MSSVTAAREKAGDKEEEHVVNSGWVTDTHSGAKGVREGHGHRAARCINEKGAAWAVYDPQMKTMCVEAAALGGDVRTALEIDADRIRSAIGSLAVTLGELDALVFTAGVGEHAARLRASVCEGLECLGLQLDPVANDTCRPDADISRADSPARILAIRTREELTIGRETRRVLPGAGKVHP
ncbi:MAG: hypothetical protein ACRD3M_02465 [Thermoanaerobaculia bacterium]